jgi:hypothetical protein
MASFILSYFYNQKGKKYRKKLQAKNDRYVKQVASNLYICNCLPLLPIKIIQRNGERERKKENKTKGKKKVSMRCDWEVDCKQLAV